MEHKVSYENVYAYFRMGLATGIIPKQTVIAWADRELLRSAQVVPEIAELSLACNQSYSQLIGLLSSFLLDTDYGLPLSLLFAHAGIQLEENPAEVRNIILGLGLLTAEERLSSEIKRRLHELESCLEKTQAGQVDGAELPEKLAEFLQPYQRFRSLVSEISG